MPILIAGFENASRWLDLIGTVTVHHYFGVASLLFCIGLFGMITRKNAISLLMSVELMLNAVNINFVAFNRMWGVQLSRAAFTSQVEVLTPLGQVFAIFVIMLAAAEAAIGLAIIIAFYRLRKSVKVEDANLMRW